MTAATDAQSILALQAEITRLQATLTQRDQELATLRAVIDGLPYAAFWKDANAVYAGGNQRFAADLGFASPADVVGKSDNDLPWQPGEAVLFRATDERVLAQGQVEYDDSETVVYPDGRQEWFETYHIPVAQCHGRYHGHPHDLQQHHATAERRGNRAGPGLDRSTSCPRHSYR